MTGQLGGMQNREVFAKDPLATTIPNLGVVKVTEPSTAQEWAVLRYELQTFVCEGEYQRGLERILDAYLSNLGQPAQPAAWVSGFFGSGKSHLVRVLEYLWRDTALPDGATARGLVTLSPAIDAQLRELTAAGRRDGGLWSAAGTLGAAVGDSIGLALLAIVFRAAGLPESYPAARFVLWLRENGIECQVRAAVDSAGRRFSGELRSMYVSPYLANALLAALPDFAPDQRAARDLLRVQFPPVTGLSDDEMLATLDQVLRFQSVDGKRLPCTLIVLDELQQFIGDNADRSLRVQQTVEACSGRFGSRLLVVATGQSAMQGTPMLARIAGRFTVQVALSDTDVTQVVRQVVLRKRPDREGVLTEMLSDLSGEIDRQLRGSKIEPTGADAPALPADYPILPARRRLWERLLRATDRAGTSGQLRTQLRIIQEAASAVATARLGTVVPADFIYEQLKSSLQQSGVLLPDIAEIIGKQEDGSREGALRARLCAMIFLLGQLPRDSGVDIGVRATAETLADLLVADLREGGAALRGQIPGLLAGLLQNGSLMQVGEEYRLQTREGAEWTAEFRQRQGAILNDPALIADRRTTALNTGVSKELQGLRLLHGESKEPRSLVLHFDAEAPKRDSGAIPVWIRDEWATTERTVRQDAQAGGLDDPTVYVFLQKRGADDFRRVLAALDAATATIQARQGTIVTREAEEARQALESRRREAEASLGLLVAGVLAEARVFQGGGSEIALGTLRASVEDAARSALARLFPQFGIADRAKWDTVVKRARQGNADALSELGYAGEVGSHPVCAPLATFVGSFGKRGTEVRKHFAAPPYGWPKDAIDGALLTLVAAGTVQAIQNGVAVGATGLDQGKIAGAEFRSAGPGLTIVQRLAVRGLLQGAGVPFTANEEAQALPSYLRQMRDLAAAAGGAAPAPAPPDTEHRQDLEGRIGNDALLALVAVKDRLIAERAEWTARRDQIAARLPRWEALRRLLRAADGLPIAATVAPQVEAIQAGRLLLADPDPVAPLAAQVTAALRDALGTAHQTYDAAYRAQRTALTATEHWVRLTPQQREEVERGSKLLPLAAPSVGTEAQVLAAAEATPLAEWSNRTAALPERLRLAQLTATRLLTPEAISVKLPSATLATPAEVESYLDRVRTLLLERVEAGTPVVV
jgi:hypothetical protein